MNWLDQWRDFLYYPLGVLPLIFFSSRFFIQWFQSERQQRCVVPVIFWKLSLIGNTLFLLHYCIQVQYPFALIQACNAVISWRNLNLMRSPSPLSTKLTVGILVSVLVSVTSFFYFSGQNRWIHLNWSQSYGSLWHVFGFLGGALFASRFWFQWWETERTKVSSLGKTFWWLSITGSLMSITYSALLKDWVTLLPHCIGLIPYIRNLVLMRNIVPKNI